MISIKQLDKQGKEFTIRQPNEDDAASIINHSKLMFTSTDQLLTLAEEYTITIEKEKSWIKDLNENPRSLLLGAECESKLVGFLFFISNSKIKNAHVGEFGVNVHPSYQRVGIGRALIQTLLNWAKENALVEKVSLQVFASNTNAINLYQSLGFIEEGRHVKAVKQTNGEYIDVIQMYYWTK